MVVNEQRVRVKRDSLLGPFFVDAPSFEILEHPADIGFRAFGTSLAELFENAALALVSIAGEIEGVEPLSEYALEAAGGDRESLLVAWLSEVLYWLDGRHIRFQRFRVSMADDRRVTATGLGEPWEPSRHPARLLVKAVTWHQLRIARSDSGWMAEVYLDV